MTIKLNVDRTHFDLDTFHQILKAMDGYHKLPWRRDRYTEDGGRIFNTKPEIVLPWELPDMPDVSVDVWRYHVAFAIDRGFVECWKPDPYEPRHPLYYETHQFEWDIEVQQEEMNYLPPYRGTDAQVSSERAPARLTYAGKAFIDNLDNPSVKKRAFEALFQWGVPAMMNVVLDSVANVLSTDAQVVAPMQSQVDG